MARRARIVSSSSSESEDEGPEAVSLSKSKKDVQKLESERKNAADIGKMAAKERNREMDRKLKERAVKNRAKAGDKVNSELTGVKEQVDSEEGDDEDGEDAELQARMMRAMKEAQEESEEGESSGDEEAAFDSLGDESDNGSSDSDMSEANSEESLGLEDELTDSSEAEVYEPLETTQRLRSRNMQSNPNHLPDELFTAAFNPSNATTTKSDSKRKALNDQDLANTHHAKKRKPSKLSTQKDVVLGSRAIRILPTSNAPPVPSTTPSRKIRKFLDRTLALKDGKKHQRSKGWERRPANIGVLRRAGPAASFVRNL